MVVWTWIRPVMCAIVAAVLVAFPANAAQMDASDDPSVSGPLSVHDQRCDSHHQKRNGEFVIRAKTCLIIYFLNSGSDNDQAFDHGAAWLQTTVDARSGWCVSKVVPSVLISGTTRIGDSRTPARLIRTDEKRLVTARVTVDADGAAPTRGFVKQDFFLYPRSLKRVPLTETAQGDQRMKQVWEGSSAGGNWRSS